METLYRKKANGKYEPVGLDRAPDLFEGIWLIEYAEHGKSHKNLACRMADLPETVDVAQLALSSMLESSITTVLRSMEIDGSVRIYDISLHNLSEKICNEVYKKLVEKEMSKKT
jgi:hypothetical protein